MTLDPYYTSANLLALQQQAPLMRLGNSLYATTEGWGWAYTNISWLRNTHNFFFPDSITTDAIRVNELITRTQDSFTASLEEIIPYAELYNNYLQALCNGTPFESDDVAEARRRITEWNRAFCSIALSAQDERVRRITQIQSIIDIEAMLQAPLPIRCFNRVSRGEPISAQETRDLELFREKVGLQLPVRSIHNFFQSLIPIFNTLQNQEASETGLATLEHALFHRYGWRQIFLRRDLVYTLFRQSLHQQSSINLDNTTIDLNEPPADTSLSENYSCALAEGGNLIIPLNQALVGIQFLDLQQAESTRSLIPLVRQAAIRTIQWNNTSVVCIFTEGKIVSVRSFVWDCTLTDEEPTIEDERRIDAIIRFIRACMWHDVHPAQMPKRDQLFFSEENGEITLRAMQPFPSIDSKTPYSPNFFNEFITVLSDGNDKIKCILQQKFKALGDPLDAPFFKEIMRKACLNEKREDEPLDLYVQHIAKPFLAGLTENIDRGQILFTATQTVLAEAMEQLSSHFKQSSQLSSMLIEIILENAEQLYGAEDIEAARDGFKRQLITTMAKRRRSSQTLALTLD